MLAPKAETSLAPDTAAATPKGEVDSNGKPRLATQEKGGAGSGSALASFATTSPDAQPLRPGVRVKAKYLASDPAIRPSGAERSRGYGPGRWYEGTVHAVNADGTYAVAYDDGDFEASVQCEYIQVVITDASAAVDALGAVAVEADRRQSAGSGEGELGTVEGGGIEGGGIEGGGIEGGGIKSRGVGEVKAEIDGGDGSGEGDITADGESNGDGNACGLDGDSTHANGDGAADGNADRDEDGDVDGEGEGSASYEAMYGVSGRPRNTWLACDVCGQWRRLGKMRTRPPETTCTNPDPAFAKCEVPQELPDDDIDRLLEFSQAQGTEGSQATQAAQATESAVGEASAVTKLAAKERPRRARPCRANSARLRQVAAVLDESSRRRNCRGGGTAIHGTSPTSNTAAPPHWATSLVVGPG